MSVINKMLRDLDQRQLAGAAPQTGHGARVVLGTVPLAALPAATRPPMLPWRVVGGGALLLAIAVAGGMGFVKSKQENVQSAVATVTTVPVMSAPMAAAPQAPLVAASASVAVPLASAPRAAFAALAPVSALVSKTFPHEAKELSGLVASKNIAEYRLDGVKKAGSLPVAKIAPVMAEPAGGASLLHMDTVLSKKPPATGLADDQATEGRSASETLAQAQSMWNAGSHVAAMELLQQALSQVEASSTVALPVTGQSALARLAREWARMALAEGQVRQALAVLVRLEPQLSQIAEVWAMRGNAHQRLGQHADAVKSYGQALLLKPDEPRWMAGEAVSLAVQGQTAAAGELAEKSRALGALRPEVAAYLRQLGVVLRSD